MARKRCLNFHYSYNTVVCVYTNHSNILQRYCKAIIIEKDKGKITNHTLKVSVVDARARALFLLESQVLRLILAYAQ